MATPWRSQRWPGIGIVAATPSASATAVMRLIDLLRNEVSPADQAAALAVRSYLGDETEEVNAAPAKPVNEDRAPWDDLRIREENHEANAAMDVTARIS